LVVKITKTCRSKSGQWNQNEHNRHCFESSNTEKFDVCCWLCASNYFM